MKCPVVLDGALCTYQYGHAGPHSWEDDDDPGRFRGLTEEQREQVMRSSGHKDDFGKTNFFAAPWEALDEMAMVMTFGAQKYRMFNFRKGMQYSRLWSAAIRHLHAWRRGEENDEESGISHLAHALCCIAMLREIQIIETGEDDRPHQNEVQDASRSHSTHP